MLNRRYAPFHLMLIAEVAIRAGGSLGLPDRLLDHFDLVMGDVNTDPEGARGNTTERVVRATRNPRVDLLAAGRSPAASGSPGIDMDVVIRAAAEHGVALELAGRPDRIGAETSWVRLAVDAGVQLVCGSGAHAAAELPDVTYALAAARRGWAEPRNVLNALPLEDLVERLKTRRRRPHAA